MELFQKPGEDGFSALVAENRLISDIQVSIEGALTDRNMTQSDLAQRLGVSSARVSQILGDNGTNLTARTVAKIAHVLGLRASLVFTDTVVEGWMREEWNDVELTSPLAVWVAAACETIEGQGGHPTTVPSNDQWLGGAGTDGLIPAADDTPTVAA